MEEKKGASKDIESTNKKGPSKAKLAIYVAAGLGLCILCIALSLGGLHVYNTSTLFGACEFVKDNNERVVIPNGAQYITENASFLYECSNGSLQSVPAEITTVQES